MEDHTMTEEQTTSGPDDGSNVQSDPSELTDEALDQVDGGTNGPYLTIPLETGTITSY